MIDPHELDLYVRIAIYTFIFVFGICGNIFVVFFFGLKMKRQSHGFRWFVIHLAVADCIYSFASPLQLIARNLYNEKWLSTITLCRLVYYIGPITVNVSALILTFLAYERFRAICFPFERRMTEKKIHLTVALIWIFCILIKLPAITKLVLVDQECYVQASGRFFFIMSLVYFATESALPIMLHVYLFTRIRLVFRKRLDFLNKTTILGPVEVVLNTSCSNLLDSDITQNENFGLQRAILYLNEQARTRHQKGHKFTPQRKQTRTHRKKLSQTVKASISRIIKHDSFSFGIKNHKDRRTVKALFFAVLIFVVASLPYNIYYCTMIYMLTYHPSTSIDHKTTEILASVFDWLGVILLSSSIANIFVYGGSFPAFRQQMYLWFKKAKRKLSLSPIPLKNFRRNSTKRTISFRTAIERSFK